MCASGRLAACADRYGTTITRRCATLAALAGVGALSGHLCSPCVWWPGCTRHAPCEGSTGMGQDHGRERSDSAEEEHEATLWYVVGTAWGFQVSHVRVLCDVKNRTWSICACTPPLPSCRPHSVVVQGGAVPGRGDATTGRCGSLGGVVLQRGGGPGGGTRNGLPC